jgi:phenylalanyl-tRNA synthetase beta chain
MLISYNWLRELTDTRLSTKQLRDRLTMVGLAIDSVDEHVGDSVLDVEVPSNRPDCLSHVGIAREVTVIEDGVLKLPTSSAPPTDGTAAQFTSVDIQDPELCPRYAARIIRGVKIGPSPDWLVKRLETIGQRSINNVADITNYVLHEVGQPLHAFDYHKLAGHRIVVRRSVSGEKLKTLDGVERELTEEMLVIADADRPVALAGIMGGEESEISAATTDVLIESAYFNPDSVRRTARKLQMDTEASRRFERGADCEGVLRAQQRCVELICEIAGGVATTDSIDLYPSVAVTREVSLHPNRVEALTSLMVPVTEMRRILERLGFVSLQTESKSELCYRVPSWRIDVEQEEDLVEEVARHYGYEKIADALPPSNSSGEYQPTEIRQRSLRRALIGAGFDEAINLSFTQQQSEFELIPVFSDILMIQPELVNPIIEGAARMRSTLLPGLLNSVRHNFNHGMRDVRLFEIGRVFGTSGDGVIPEEALVLSLVATGGSVEENRAVADRELDFFDLKGALETAVDWMNLSPLVYQKADIKHLRPGQSAILQRADGEPIGSAGRLSEALGASSKFRQPVFVAELDLFALLTGPEKVVQYRPLARYPSVVRDISLLLDRKIQFEEILNAVREQNVADCRGAKFVGVYEGANIEPNKRSVTVRIEYRSDERTLTDEEVEERHAQLIASLLRTFSAEQR